MEKYANLLTEENNLSGYFLRGIEKLRRNMNFTIGNKIMEDEVGSRSENGVYTGAIGAMKNCQFCLLVALAVLEENRMQVVDYTSPIGHAQIRGFYAMPEKLFPWTVFIQVKNHKFSILKTYNI